MTSSSNDVWIVSSLKTKQKSLSEFQSNFILTSHHFIFIIILLIFILCHFTPNSLFLNTSGFVCRHRSPTQIHSSSPHIRHSCCKCHPQESKTFQHHGERKCSSQSLFCFVCSRTSFFRSSPSSGSWFDQKCFPKTGLWCGWSPTSKITHRKEGRKGGRNTQRREYGTKKINTINPTRDCCVFRLQSKELLLFFLKAHCSRWYLSIVLAV